MATGSKTPVQRKLSVHTVAAVDGANVIITEVQSKRFVKLGSVFRQSPQVAQGIDINSAAQRSCVTRPPKIDCLLVAFHTALLVSPPARYSNAILRLGGMRSGNPPQRKHAEYQRDDDQTLVR